MSTLDEVDKLRRRLVAAETERDACRARDQHDHYLQAYVHVKELELQLEEALRQPLR